MLLETILNKELQENHFNYDFPDDDKTPKEALMDWLKTELPLLYLHDNDFTLEDVWYEEELTYMNTCKVSYPEYLI